MCCKGLEDNATQRTSQCTNSSKKRHSLLADTLELLPKTAIGKEGAVLTLGNDVERRYEVGNQEQELQQIKEEVSLLNRGSLLC